jgi:hypothetical protein
VPRGMYETYDLTACDDFTNGMGIGAVFYCLANTFSSLMN